MNHCRFGYFECWVGGVVCLVDDIERGDGKVIMIIMHLGNYDFKIPEEGVLHNTFWCLASKQPIDV